MVVTRSEAQDIMLAI